MINLRKHPSFKSEDKRQVIIKKWLISWERERERWKKYGAQPSLEATATNFQSRKWLYLLIDVGPVFSQAWGLSLCYYYFLCSGDKWREPEQTPSWSWIKPWWQWSGGHIVPKMIMMMRCVPESFQCLSFLAGWCVFMQCRYWIVDRALQTQGSSLPQGGYSLSVNRGGEGMQLFYEWAALGGAGLSLSGGVSSRSHCCTSHSLLKYSRSNHETQQVWPFLHKNVMYFLLEQCFPPLGPQKFLD